MEIDIQLADHLQKCRCCFRVLINDNKSLQIDSSIKQKFFELTQIELIMDPLYSTIICEMCFQDLRNFYFLKKDISLKQKRLYELLPVKQSRPNLPEVISEIEKDLESRSEVYDDDDPPFIESQEIKRNETTPSVDLGDKGGNHKIETTEIKSIIKPSKKVSVRPITKEKPKQQSFSKSTRPSPVKHFQCPDCGLQLANKFTLQRHIDRIHRKIKSFFCDSCEYSSFFKHSMAKHLLKHIPEEFRERFKCDECDFISISQVNISLHKKYEHGKVGKFKCKAEKCGKSFSRPTQLNAHVKLTHEKVKDKVCKDCGKTFSTATRLKEHFISVHSSNQRDFVCEVCSKGFLSMQSLKNHQIYHQEPKFACEMGCSKKFYHAVLLQGHHKTHSNSKDFKCSYESCGRKYLLKSHLKRHVESTHEKLKIPCGLCSVSFLRRESYKKHILKLHPGLNETDVKKLMDQIKS